MQKILVAVALSLALAHPAAAQKPDCRSEVTWNDGKAYAELSQSASDDRPSLFAQGYLYGKGTTKAIDGSVAAPLITFRLGESGRITEATIGFANPDRGFLQAWVPGELRSAFSGDLISALSDSRGLQWLPFNLISESGEPVWRFVFDRAGVDHAVKETRSAVQRARADLRAGKCQPRSRPSFF